MTTPPVPVLVPPPEITAATLADFDRRGGDMLGGAGGGLVVDLDKVRLISSAGLGHLVRLGQSLAAADGRLALARGRRGVAKLIRTVGLDSVMPLFKSVEEATTYVSTR